MVGEELKGSWMFSVAIAWFILAIPILSFPTYLPVTLVNMNCEFHHTTRADEGRCLGGVCWICSNVHGLVCDLREEALCRPPRWAYRIVDV
jgi:hypothetical protein